MKLNGDLKKFLNSNIELITSNNIFWFKDSPSYLCSVLKFSLLFIHEQLNFAKLLKGQSLICYQLIMNIKINKIKFISAISLIISGVIGRFLFIEYIGIPNFEIVTTIALISGIYLGGLYIAIIPLSVLFISDMIIGNNFIFLFTWSAFIFISLIGFFLEKKFSRKKKLA